MELEKILGNFGKGLTAGVIKIADPVGTGLSYSDKWAIGAGYSSERSVETFHNHLYKLTHYNPEEELNGKEDYVPRIAGAVSGIGLGVLGLYGLYAINPALGFAIPVITGLYGMLNYIGDYIQGFTKGEKSKNREAQVEKTTKINKKGEIITTTSGEAPQYKGYTLKEILIDERTGKRTENFYDRASFEEGFYYGWNQSTHFYMPLVHDGEGMMTGRGLNNSRIDSSIKDSSIKMRRNLTSLAGSSFGSIIGAIVSVASLGIVPLYKSIRDTRKNLR